MPRMRKACRERARQGLLVGTMRTLSLVVSRSVVTGHVSLVSPAPGIRFEQEWRLAGSADSP